MANYLLTPTTLKKLVERNGAVYLGDDLNFVDNVHKIHISVDGQRSTHELPDNWYLNGQDELAWFISGICEPFTADV